MTNCIWPGNDACRQASGPSPGPSILLSPESNRAEDTSMKRDGEDLSSIDPNSGKRQDVSSLGRPPSPDPALISGAGQWEQHVSQKTGKPYWFNPATGQTQWTMPSSFYPPRSPPPPDNAAGDPPSIIGPGEGPKPQEQAGQPASEGTKISIDTKTAINYPKRPGQQRCTYYLTHGICKFGESCKFDHPADR